MSSYYIATGLQNAAAHRALRPKIDALGHTLTYDWTVHGSVKSSSHARLTEVAELERQAVIRSDFLVVLLPGGSGTHVELGLALASRIPIFLMGDPLFFMLGPETCAFYHFPFIHWSNNVTQLLEQLTHWSRESND